MHVKVCTVSSQRQRHWDYPSVCADEVLLPMSSGWYHSLRNPAAGLEIPNDRLIKLACGQKGTAYQQSASLRAKWFLCCGCLFGQIMRECGSMDGCRILFGRFSVSTSYVICSSWYDIVHDWVVLSLSEIWSLWSSFHFYLVHSYSCVYGVRFNSM